MNKYYAAVGWGLLITTFINHFLSLPANAADSLVIRNKPQPNESACLADVIRASHWWTPTPQFADEMMRIAKVARARLNAKERIAYLFLFEGDGWCGTAGCPMLIGERQDDGRCRLLYDGGGDEKVTVLPMRDYGYRRLYLPCEVRFNGLHYRQIRPECPTVDVPR